MCPKSSRKKQEQRVAELARESIPNAGRPGARLRFGESHTVLRYSGNALDDGAARRTMYSFACTGDLLCVLTYGNRTGDPKLDIAINYTLLFATAALFIFGGPPKRRGAMLLFFAAFQLGLCYVIGCAGVSIIWCACAGGGALDLHRGHRLVAFRVISVVVVARSIATPSWPRRGRPTCARLRAYDGLISSWCKPTERGSSDDANIHYEAPPGTPRARML